MGGGTGYVAEVMQRIYRMKLTTTSGGNLSIRDADGIIWITPGQVDKGLLQPTDIACVRPDGTVEGTYPPSSEFPFHKAIYDARPDLRAVVHAHPTASVAFSSVHQTPDTRLFPAVWQQCHPTGFVPYSMPGSEALGQGIAAAFAEGFNNVVLENHGVCCGGVDLLEALQRFETLELCAEASIKALSLGDPQPLSADLFLVPQNEMDEFSRAGDPMNAAEQKGREELAAFIQRGYRQRLLMGATGAFSVRLDADSFLVAPSVFDRCSVVPNELMLIRGGKREWGGTPSSDWPQHAAVYAANPDVQAIITAQPANALAFSLCHQPVDTHMIPEAYMFVGDVAFLPFEVFAEASASLGKALTLQSPAAVIGNGGVMVVGRTLLSAFDRLEVLESSAEAILKARPLGGHVAMSRDKLDELRMRYPL